jgi:hypothetical protein
MKTQPEVSQLTCRAHDVKLPDFAVSGFRESLQISASAVAISRNFPFALECCTLKFAVDLRFDRSLC